MSFLFEILAQLPRDERKRLVEKMHADMEAGMSPAEALLSRVTLAVAIARVIIEQPPNDPQELDNAAFLVSGLLGGLKDMGQLLETHMPTAAAKIPESMANVRHAMRMMKKNKL